MSMGAGYRPHITFLLGKPLRMSSVIAHVIQRLHREVPMVTVYRPGEGNQLPPLIFQSDLVVQRGLIAGQLDSAVELELAGVRCINSPTATHTMNNRAQIMSLLAAAALPVPETITAQTWDEVIEITDKRPVVVKGLDGSEGRGLNVHLAANGYLPSQAPFEAPFIVQEYIPSNAMVRKLYVIGRHTRGLIKNAGVMQTSSTLAVPIDVDRPLSDLARHAGAVLGMQIYGVDILYSLNGPIIIDANPFPGFRNVPDAARLIADHLSGIVTGSEGAARSGRFAGVVSGRS
jgi:ribosomal protein S6--L-glutamate ligase